jgi:hypothetical protein
MVHAESRVHQFGNDRKVEVTYLLVKGTTDNMVWRTIVKKEGVLTKAGLYDQQITGDVHAIDYVSESEDENEEEDSQTTVESDSDSEPLGILFLDENSDEENEGLPIDSHRTGVNQGPTESSSDFFPGDSEPMEIASPVRRSRRIRERRGSDVTISEDELLEIMNAREDNNDPSIEDVAANRSTRARRNLLCDSEDTEVSQAYSPVIDPPESSQTSTSTDSEVADDTPQYIRNSQSSENTWSDPESLGSTPFPHETTGRIIRRVSSSSDEGSVEEVRLSEECPIVISDTDEGETNRPQQVEHSKLRKKYFERILSRNTKQSKIESFFKRMSSNK